MLAQQGAQMLPFVLPVENSSAKKGRACAQCIGEAAGGARRVCGASNVKKNHDTLVECRKQKCVCAVQCVMRVSCGEQFTRHMFGADADRAVGSHSRAAQRVCQSRWCALPRRGRHWRACDFVRGESFSAQASAGDGSRVVSNGTFREDAAVGQVVVPPLGARKLGGVIRSKDFNFAQEQPQGRSEKLRQHHHPLAGQLHHFFEGRSHHCFLDLRRDDSAKALAIVEVGSHPDNP